MKRKYREIKPWRKVHHSKCTEKCDHCGLDITPGSKYERRVYIETSEARSYQAFRVLREHLSPCCNQYEK